ncbi:MAG: 2-oxoglutarate dehydrogenase, E2 component, dihydrolipoamide succinyltransferase, partial [Actinomycetia bacterium]|nr:2-oxoglutarate dehydrogenase, E2 component, dihydrolipoamide succinyltransferase [Actinomycetes bacterium]
APPVPAVVTAPVVATAMAPALAAPPAAVGSHPSPAAASGEDPAAPDPLSLPPAPADNAGEDDLAGAYVTPLVRKLASEHGVDLSTVTGSGVGGRVRKSDVLAAATAAASAAAPASPSPAPSSAPAASPVAPAAATGPSALATPVTSASGPVASVAAPGDRVEKMSRRRKLIASRMVDALRTAAQLTTVVEVDVTPIARLRERIKDEFEIREGVKLTYLPFFAIATIDALKAQPVMNCSIDTDAGTITYHDAQHLGIAVDTPAGLTVPVIHNAGDLNLAGLARKIADLAERTRTNKISPDELAGGTFTVSNTGSRGALFDTPILTPPQVAILGTGSVVKRPVVISDANLGETIAVRSVAYFALSYDHRIIDGADAARFLQTVKTRLESGGFEAAGN